MLLPLNDSKERRTRLPQALSTLVLFGVLGWCAWRWLRRHDVRITLEFRWYDLWTGIYIRPHKPGETTRHLYWCPLWGFAIHFEWPRPSSRPSLA
jgi:hypothetical protein